MLAKLKICFKWILYKMGYDLISLKLITNSDDPYWIITKLFSKEKVKLIVDGGASIGDTSIKLSKLFPQSIVHSFEPFPKFYSQLEDHSTLNNKIMPYNMALSDYKGNNLLFVNKSEGTNSLSQSNVNKEHPHYDLLSPVNSVDVMTSMLDDIFPNETIDILKLDLQGGEYKALKGAKNLLKENRISCILCEVMFVKTYEEQTYGSVLVSFIENHGFYIFNIYQSHHHHGCILQADILFIHNSLKEKISQTCKNIFMPFSKYQIRK